MSTLMEIDDAMNQKIKTNLKAYTDSLKKGKSRSDPELEKWVDKNTERFMVGRSKANPKLELGQWYIYFKTLAPEKDVTDHPCKNPNLPFSPFLLFLLDK